MVKKNAEMIVKGYGEKGIVRNIGDNEHNGMVKKSTKDMVKKNAERQLNDLIKKNAERIVRNTDEDEYSKCGGKIYKEDYEEAYREDGENTDKTVNTERKLFEIYQDRFTRKPPRFIDDLLFI